MTTTEKSGSLLRTSKKACVSADSISAGSIGRLATVLWHTSIGLRMAKPESHVFADFERACDLTRVVAVPDACVGFRHPPACPAPLAGELVFQFPEPELDAV